MRTRFLPASATLSRLQDACRVIWQTLLIYLAFDKYVVAITIGFSLLFIPLIPRTTDNAQKLAAFINDEPALTMALEAMTVRPYGNPGNFYRRSGQRATPPAHWGSLNYAGFNYYGGTYLGLGFVAFAPLYALGLPTFPIAPIILRTISTIAGLLSLILLYNFAKRYAGIAVGLIAVFVLMTDSSFIYYTSIIHPDTLQLFLGLLACLVAVQHVMDGQVASLIALGLVSGLVQGTKAGGPWLMPMTLLAVYWGLRHTVDSVPSWAGCMQLYVRRLCYMGAAALLAYGISTPYAFLDGYYFTSMARMWRLVSKGPLGEVNFLTWLKALRTYWGDVPLLLTLVAFLRILLQACKGKGPPAFGLAMVLAASQLLWFGATGGLWVVLRYMLIAFSLGTVITVDMVVRALAVLQHTKRYISWLYPTAVILLFAVIVESRWFTLASHVLQLHMSDRSTTVEIGRWAAQASIPKESHIVYDDLAYFDPQLFPNSRMHGGVLTWPALRKLQPDLIVLSSTIYEASWYAELRRTQHLSREDTYPFSMRLYQELADYEIPGPTAIPGITLLKVIRPTSPPVFVLPSYIVWLQPHLTRLLGVDATQWIVARLSQHAAWMSYLAWLIRNALGLEHALIGPTLKVYQTDLTTIHGPGLSYDE